MRLYLKDADASEITGTNITDCRNKMTTGGNVALTIHDPYMANIATVHKTLNQRVEVKKNDGSTVIWEGFITDHDYDSRHKGWVLSGPEGLQALDEVNVDYDGNKGSGVVTAIDDDDTPPTITDKNQTFDSTYEGYECLFTNQNIPSVERQYPDSDTDFYNGGNAPDSSSGDYEDLAAGGTTGMTLTDTKEEGADYYGVELSFTFTQYATAQKLVIVIDTKRQYRSYYSSDGSDNCLVQIYDVGETAWQTTNGNGVTGLGRQSAGWGKYGGNTNANMNEVIIIDDTDIASYFDGSGTVLVRVSAGGAIATNYITIYQAYGDLTYANLYAAEANAYTIDDATGSVLTFTGQTPYADGITVGDTFRIGQDVDTIIAKAWRNGMVDWIDYETDGVTGIVDCSNLKGAKLGHLLRRYMDQIGWDVWQEIGWNVRLGDTYDASGLSLTEADFVWFTFGCRGRQLVRRINVFSVQFWQGLVENVVDGLQSVFDKLIGSYNQNTQAAVAQTIDNTLTRYQELKFRFRGKLDMTGGAYDAIEVGKTITITLYTDKAVITNGVIEEIAWSQKHNGHLYAEIVVRTA